MPSNNDSKCGQVYRYPTDIRAGIYQHYKGEYYLVLGLAHHSETMERLVVYVPLYVREGPRMAVRPVEMFFGLVCRLCEYMNHYGPCPEYSIVERFRYIGAEMPQARTEDERGGVGDGIPA